MTSRQRKVQFDKGAKTDDAGKPRATGPPAPEDATTRKVLLIVFFWVVVGVVAFNPTLRKSLLGMETKASGLKWWQTSIVYQIYPRCFQDSDGDGIGDLRGILRRLNHFQYLGVDAIWLSPIYTSPMVDFGYDVANFTEIDPMFGTMLDFEELVEEAHAKGLYVIMDFIPNHTSDKHKWFVESCKGKKGPYADYFMWSDGKVLENGTRVPPNNWISVFGGSMWEWVEERQQYYLHQFTKEQPDLNFRNPKVHQEIDEAMAFWIEKGVDGFRVDAIRHMFEAADISQDEPRSMMPGTTPDQYEYYKHPHTVSLPEVHDVVRNWKKLMTKYEEKTGRDLYMVVEVYGDYVGEQMPYYHSGADMPFNFKLQFVNRTCGGRCVQELVESWMDAMPEGKWPNWVIGNHDQKRITHKMGENFANSMNLLLLLLPGTPTTYYGEEIGMLPISVSYEDTQDPHGKNFGPDRYEEFSRDPCRAPMQWSSDPQAGFSESPNTWLPVHPGYKSLNVQVQKRQATSPLELYRKLARLRKQPVFQTGDFDTALANDNIYSFVRFTRSQPVYLVTVNFGTETSTDNYTGYSGKFPPAGKFIPDQGAVVLHTQNFAHKNYDIGSVVDLERLTLEPGQGLVIKFWQGR